MSSLRQEFPSLSSRQLCALLHVSRSWMYERPHAPTQAERDVALRDAIEHIVLEFPGYGYRRVGAELHRQQWAVNHKRGWIATTDSRHGLQTYPNLLAGLALRRPNQAWVADITYIRLPTAFVYLACVLDAWSRRCVGWQLSRTIDTQLTLAALNHAIAVRRPGAGLIHHSDRGVQYASAAYVERLIGIGA
jgi:putative transposase